MYSQIETELTSRSHISGGSHECLGFYSALLDRKGNDLFLATGNQQIRSSICQIGKNEPTGLASIA
jgi:hypothetical protein